VARPAGLIVLGRAGDLIDEVQDYIQSGQDFNLKCLIPHLTLSNDGGLKCQSSDKKLNLLDQVLQDHPEPSYWHAHLPEIGPDQIGTLSFTSGSTGIPKGVRGRHFSLTHFYPWMATEFGITRNEQFTMLSGIAHDPIQRDSKIQIRVFLLLVLNWI
jgi:L-aminoadipate-semialdehyde dehydrogenase